MERYNPLPTVPRDGRDPLLPGLDRWGQFAMPRGGRDDRYGISAESAAAIVDRHLAGTAGFRILDAVAEPADDDTAANDAAMVAHETPQSAVAYSEGIARRRAASERLADLDATFTAIEQRAADLTAWLDSLLADTHDNPRP